MPFRPRSVVALVSIGAAVGVGAQTPRPPAYCDDGLLATRNVRDARSYQPRDDRCEGLYTRGDSGFASVVYLVGGAPQIARTDQAISVTWTGAGDKEVHIRAASLRKDVHFRMDTARTGHQYIWPTSFLWSLPLQPPDVGIVAWTNATVGKSAEPVLVPVAIGATSQLTQPYTAGVRLASEFLDLKLTLGRIDPASGNELARVVTDSDLKLGYYPPDGTIDVPLPVLLTPGTYQLKVAGTIRTLSGPKRSGGVTAYFLHGM